MEEWFRVRARAREYSSSFRSVFFFCFLFFGVCFFFAVGLLLSVFSFFFLCDQSFGVTFSVLNMTLSGLDVTLSVLNVTSRVLYFCY